MPVLESTDCSSSDFSADEEPSSTAEIFRYTQCIIDPSKTGKHKTFSKKNLALSLMTSSPKD